MTDSRVRRFRARLIGPETRFFQVSTDVYNDGTDHWSEFEISNSVQMGAGVTLEARRGDVILVSFGSSGRGIGVVQKNSDADGGWSKGARVSVHWVNTRGAQLANVTGQYGLESARAQAVTGSAARPLVEGKKRLTAKYTKVGAYRPPKLGSIIDALYNALSAADDEASGARLVASVKGFVKPQKGEPMSEGEIANTLTWLVKNERLHVLPAAQHMPVEREARPTRRSGRRMNTLIRLS